MKRDALGAFLRRLVIVTLPLAGCSSSGLPTTTDGGGPDMASAPPIGNGSCQNPPTYIVDGGLGDMAPWDCQSRCPSPYGYNCTESTNAAGLPVTVCTELCLGRRPAALHAAATPRGGDALGQLLAQMAHLEAASVPAFRMLAAELEAHGAPRALIAAARRAIADERRHARAATALARRHGATPPALVVDETPLRDLEAVALENATEGCVFEAWGALMAAWQARTAGDRALRRLMTGIAPDEVRHAELAWAVARFAEPRLSAAARRRVHEARRGALATLDEATEREPPAELVAAAGVPTTRAARALARAFRSDVLQRARAA